MSSRRVTAEKARWRERFRTVRRAMPPEALAAASATLSGSLAAVIDAALADALGSMPDSAVPDTVALFWPLPGEIDLRPLAQSLRQRGVTVALPVVVGPRQLTWRLFEGTDQLTDGPWGLREPAPEAPTVEPARLAVVVVPGLAFGRDGSRLGYGGGFYDAALAETPALRVGVAVEAALTSAVPREPHDARVDAIVTEAGVWRVSESDESPREP